MKNMMILLMVAGVLTGCATTPPGESSTWYRIPVGSELMLETAVRIPAWQKKVYFQDGFSMDHSQVNIYRPHCALGVAEKSDSDQSISPDRFKVKSFRSERFFKQVRRGEPTPPVQLASAGSPATTVSGIFQRDGSDYEVTAMVMALESANQPHVTSLICADWGLPQDTMHITVEKVRKALGEMWRLEIHSP